MRITTSMKPVNWKCGYCGHAQVVTDQNRNIATAKIHNDGSKYGPICKIVDTIACANEDCRELTLIFTLYRVNRDGGVIHPAIHSWPLLPESTAKPQPDYISKSIVDNYIQACRIRDLSPNASAAMSRRCLQGMIRDFWDVNGERTLSDEIHAIEDKVDPTTLSAIDAVREIGNIGAHMEKDANLILDVEPNEAQALINLIEMLFEEWYIHRHERQKRADTVVDLGRMKKSQKNAAAGKNSKNPSHPTA